MQKYNRNIYALYEAHRRGLKNYFNTLSLSLRTQKNLLNFFGLGNRDYKDLLSVTAEMSDRLSRDYNKPSFNLSVKEQLVLDKDFGSLLHFKRDGKRNDPKVLIIAPMSGHFSTLLRDTVAALIPHHDVYITDWKDARHIPVEKGEFGLDDYVDYIHDFIQVTGKNTHIIAVCQPTIATVSAVALLAEKNSPHQPLSMTLMAGPLDTRVAETQVSKLAKDNNLDWFKENMIAKVPSKYAGAGRFVYPGFIQLYSFMSMHADEHSKAHLDLVTALAKADHSKADKIKAFYDEYLAICDIPAKLYLDTIEKVFADQHLAKGILTHRGRIIDPSKIKKTALLTVEGANDDVVAPGQTKIAHALCSGLSECQKFHRIQADVGHFQVFSGDLWFKEVAPAVTKFIRIAATQNKLKHSKLQQNQL